MSRIEPGWWLSVVCGGGTERSRGTGLRLREGERGTRQRRRRSHLTMKPFPTSISDIRILTFQPLPRRPSSQRPGQHRGGKETPQSSHERRRDGGLAEVPTALLPRPPGGGDADRRSQRGRPEQLEAGHREGEQGHVVRAHGPAPAEEAHGRHGGASDRKRGKRKEEREEKE